MSAEPTRPFQNAREVLKTHVARIVEGIAGQPEKTAVTYRVSGGPPGKRLLTTLNEVKSLFRQVEDSGLLEQVDTGKGFLPDSVIGSIIIESPDARVAYHFLAEEHQQKSQQKEPTPPVQRLKATLENLSEKVRKQSVGKKASQKNKKQRR